MAARKLPPAKAPAPTGFLHIPRDIAIRWVPWFEREVADIRNAGHLGTTGFIQAIATAARSKVDSIGNDPQITFKNFTKSMVDTLTDFHRRVFGEELTRGLRQEHEIMYALGVGLDVPGPVQPEIPPDELQRAKDDLKTPWVPVPFVPVEVKEVKPTEKVLF